MEPFDVPLRANELLEGKLIKGSSVELIRVSDYLRYGFVHRSLLLIPFRWFSNTFHSFLFLASLDQCGLSILIK